MPEGEVLDAPVKNYGYHAEEGDAYSEDFEQPEKPTEPAAAPALPEEKQEADIKPAEAKPEEAKPGEVKPAENIIPPEKSAEVTTADWRTALKQADKWEALKELGYDDFAINLLKYKEATGDVTPYLQAKSTDFSAMTPEDVLRYEMKKANPGMSEKALNFKINKDLQEKYYLNRDDYPKGSEEAEYGQEQLRIDAEQKRKALIEEQNQFKAPEPQPDLEATKREAALQQQLASIGQSVMNNDATKNLQTTKTITFGEGEESFNYPIGDVESLVDTALNAVISSGRTELTGVDLNMFYKQLAISRDLPGFFKMYDANREAIAKKKLQAELQNATPSKAREPAMEENLTPAQQLARHGRFN